MPPILYVIAGAAIVAGLAVTIGLTIEFWNELWQAIERRETRIAEEDYMAQHWDNGE